MTVGRLSVLHVHSGNLYGGVERILEVLAAASADSELDSSFALCFSGRLSDALARSAAAVHDLGAVQARRPGQVMRARARLAAVIRRRRPDIALVHSSWAQAIFGPVLAAEGVPVARWMHAPEPGPAWLEWWAGRSQPSLVIYNSRYTRDRTPRRDVPSAIVYPPMAAQPAPGSARADVRTELGATGGTVVVAIAARLESWKGHRLLVDAFAGVAGADCELWVIGGVQRPQEQAYLDALARQVTAHRLDGRVRFLGQREDVPRLLAAADLYCQPNTGPEPFGISFVEALAAGLPVVATRMGAAPEIVTEDCGILVEPRPEAVAAALATLIADPGARSRLGAAARRRAQVFCDREASIAALADSLRAAVSPLALTR